MKIIIFLFALLTSALPSFAHKFQYDPNPIPARIEDQKLPTVAFARAVLRVKIGEFSGTVLDYNTPFLCLGLVWEDSRAPINGERCWLATFQYNGTHAWLRGHGNTPYQIGVGDFISPIF